MEGVLSPEGHFHALQILPFATAQLPLDNSLPSPTTFDDILSCIRHCPEAHTLGGFLKQLFTVPALGEPNRSPRHRQMVSRFLGGFSSIHASDVATLMFNHKHSSPKPMRQRKDGKRNEEKKRRNAELMARWKLKEWAIERVAEVVDEEAKSMAAKKSGLHLAQVESTWHFVHSFSLDNIASIAMNQCPTVLRLLQAVAIPHNEQSTPIFTLATPSTALPFRDSDIASMDSSSSTATVTASPSTSLAVMEESTGSQPAVARTGTSAPSESAPQPGAAPATVEAYFGTAASGRGINRRDPLIIILVTLMMLMNARNAHFTSFQKVVGSWLFANSAAHGVYSILGRMGLCVSYSTTLNFLRLLSKSARASVHHIALSRMFLLIYDNINRMHRVWDPELGQKDVMDCGTAATFVIMDDCEPEAFDPKVLEEARAKRKRTDLNVDVLRQRVDWNKLNDVLAVHCLSFLAREVPELSKIQDFLSLRLRTSLAIHRMRDGRQTKIYPLGTSEHDEGTTDGNQKVLDDLTLNQLGLKKEEIDKVLMIVGGDQSMVEKLRTLKKFLDECPHGYARYGWVLPLIQLWHMGWADLERILATHWGGSDAADISTFRFMNERLGRKVKNVKRPDFYPAQALVFDTLEAEVLDCWRLHLNTKGQSLQEYFALPNNQLPVEELLVKSKEIVNLWMSTFGSECALHGEGISTRFPTGSPWTSPYKDEQEAPIPPKGDQILANTILRMRDSMLHYEFQSAVADGDIGRAMNVMAVWAFTFTGSGKSKYSNELLELTCNFEYEYSEHLKTAILNNWLCNLSGFNGCWFPMDLLQEHNIRQLKSMSDRRHADFGSDFFKEVIAYNIRGFLDIKEMMNVKLTLRAKGGSHHRERKVVSLRHLTKSMDEHELHCYRPTRTYQHKAQDDFMKGYIALEDGTHIQRYVECTIGGTINNKEDNEVEQGNYVSEEAEDDNAVHRLQMPNMMCGGVLVEGGEVSEDENEE